MATKIGDAFVEISAEDKKFNSKLGALRGRFSAFASGLGRMARRAGIVIGAALVAGLGLAVKKMADQETAANDLGEALKSTGNSVAGLLPRYQQFAKAVQDQTTYGDEAVLSMMAQIHNLGVTSDKLEEATKGAIGLAKALKLDQSSAARYAALALNGEFTILQRYVPALRTATTEGEKMAIVQDLMRKGYEQAQGEITTTAGATKQLKNSFGDALEQIGFLITDSASLAEMMGKIKNAIDKVTEALERLRSQDWLAQQKQQWALFAADLERKAKLFKAWFKFDPGSRQRIEMEYQEDVQAIYAKYAKKIAEKQKEHEAARAAAVNADKTMVEKAEESKTKKIKEEQAKRVESLQGFADVLKHAQESEARLARPGHEQKAGAQVGGWIGGPETRPMFAKTELREIEKVLHEIAENTARFAVFA